MLPNQDGVGRPWLVWPARLRLITVHSWDGGGALGPAVHRMAVDTDLSVCVARADRLRGSWHTGIYHQTRSFACAWWLAARGTTLAADARPRVASER